MNSILYLIIGPILWCAYTAVASRLAPYSLWSSDTGEFILGLIFSPFLWPLGIVVGVFCWLGGLLYDLLTS